MTNRIVYRVGKVIAAIGSFISDFGSNIEWYGREMWGKNCTCNMCQERKNNK